MRLLIFHYHDRPGGVREVISRGLPLLRERLPGLRGIVFLTGELTDPAWGRELESRLGGMSIRWEVDREWGYAAPGFHKLSPGSVRKLSGILKSPASPGGTGGNGTLLWAHNLSVGRNIPLLRALPGLCQDAGAGLWLHHHDWWWDGRWQRWRDWRAAGLGTLDEALSATLPVSPHVQHRCISLADLPFLQKVAGDAARWVGNPLPAFSPPTLAEIHAARRWLDARTGGRPVWLAPVRALRRKNLAESLLLTRSLAPEACLVTTGGCVSADEAASWRKFTSTAASRGWPVVPGILAAAGPEAPGVPALMAAADAVVITSLQEGFGLPWLEAAMLDKPVISRRLPDAVENLSALGCRLSGTYDSLAVPPHFYDRNAEDGRVWGRRRQLMTLLPEELREEVELESMGPAAASSEALPAERPPIPGSGRPGTRADFGELTMEAQLEVLSSPWTDLSVSAPQKADWPVEDRKDHWADRFLLSGAPGAPLSHPYALPFGNAPRLELSRRLRNWLRHPLLWPGN